MDKTGDPSYIRLPTKLELLIIEQADKEGRNKNQMIIHLIAIKQLSPAWLKFFLRMGALPMLPGRG